MINGQTSQLVQRLIELYGNRKALARKLAVSADTVDDWKDGTTHPEDHHVHTMVALLITRQPRLIGKLMREHLKKTGLERPRRK